MASKIEINISTLSGDLEDLRSYAKKARSDFEDMIESINALNATWEGAAHDAFNASYSNDCSVMEGAMDVLDRFLDSVRFARDEYSKCETSVGEKVSSIQV